MALLSNSRFITSFVTWTLEVTLARFLKQLKLIRSFHSLAGNMHVFSSNFTAQYTRLQFRSHPTASRTNQGLQNRPVHLTRRWVEIRFRGHSTGWWLILFIQHPARQHRIDHKLILICSEKKFIQNHFRQRVPSNFLASLFIDSILSSREKKNRYKRLQCSKKRERDLCIALEKRVGYEIAVFLDFVTTKISFLNFKSVLQPSHLFATRRLSDSFFTWILRFMLCVILDNKFLLERTGRSLLDSVYKSLPLNPVFKWFADKKKVWPRSFQSHLL